jgi:L-ascorbate metabolism protein UlaG (beta-lactamase superfamily)
LAQYPGTAFISTGEAVNELLAIDPALEKRATAFDLIPGESRELKVNGMQVNGYFLTHGINEAGVMVPNLGFLVTLNDIKVFHSGDMDVSVVSVEDLKAYGLPEQQIDLAFLMHTAFLTETVLPLVTEGVAARYSFPIHYHLTLPPFVAALVTRQFPEAILFEHEMEPWVMP